MKMKKASPLFLAAAIIVGGVSCQRVLQAVPPVVGVDPASSASTTVSSPGAESTSAMPATAEEELIKALEFDDHVTVVSPVEVSELLCDTLVDAEDAASLSFVLVQNETITAEKTYYTVTSGAAFTDGLDHKVWMGVVTDPAQGNDEAVPRTVSMVWADVCGAETFLLKVTKQSIDGTTSIVKTVPCLGLTTRTCLVEVEVEFDEPGEGISPNNGTITGGAISTDSSEGSTTAASTSSGRRLQDNGDTVIDVMILYSSDALLSLGGISPDQIETNIIESIAGTNQAFVNSEVALSLNVVRIGPLPYEQTSINTEDSLFEFNSNGDVGDLRDAAGADLVQMVGFFDDGFCGRGFLFQGVGDPAFATSVVGATCLDDRTVPHEFGHNLGCDHNREDATSSTEYAHGLRYCTGDDPYITIMSMFCGFSRVNYFSNPDVIILDKPTGTATENNARAIRDNMASVSNYRSLVTPPTPPPTLPPSPTPTTTYAFVGCYEDNSRDRVLSGRFVKGDRSMTTEVCAEFCLGSPYFGTEFGQECFCGVDSDDPSRLDGARCTFDCAGDDTQTCGGFNAISVYEYSTVVVTPAEYLGCWRDSQSARIMDVVESDSRSMTNDLCAEICTSYAFFGTQYGRECWCGDDMTDHTTHGESTSCNRACTGDADTICGGFNAMSVWQHLVQ